MAIKLVFFDMEGTLFEKDIKGESVPSAWPVLAKHLGEEAYEENEGFKEKALNGEYNGYVEWVEETVEMYKRHGLTKDFFEKTLRSRTYHVGVEQTFKKLKERGLRTAIISGGFQEQADRAQRDLKVDHAFAACRIFWNESGTIEHFNSLPCDYEGKVDFMQLIMKEHGLKSEECAFVGDGENDIPFAKAVGVSIAFNAPKELQDVSTHSVNNDGDFRDILQYL